MHEPTFWSLVVAALASTSIAITYRSWRLERERRMHALPFWERKR